MYMKDIAPGELQTLPLNVLRHIDIKSREEEEAVQAEVDRRMKTGVVAIAPITFPASVTDGFGKPGHMTEAEAQALIDKRNAERRGQVEATDPAIPGDVEAAPVDTPLPETVQPLDDVEETVMEPITVNVTRAPRKKAAK